MTPRSDEGRRRGRPQLTMVAAGAAAIVLCSIERAYAQSSPDDKALATVLFQEGRTLMTAKRVPEACQKFDESQRLDPSGGTLLNLALCHEQEGRLVRSWSEFNEAAVLARRDGRRDRELEAVNHVRALEPRLSRLIIVVPTAAQVEGLRICLGDICGNAGLQPQGRSCSRKFGDHARRGRSGARGARRDPFFMSVGEPARSTRPACTLDSSSAPLQARW